MVSMQTLLNGEDLIYILPFKAILIEMYYLEGLKPQNSGEVSAIA